LFTKLSLLIITCTFLLSTQLFSAEITEQKINVDVYVYHLKPPFIINDTYKLGLYFDFSDYLNSKSDKYHFETVFVPRKRIDIMLQDDNFNGVLLGVSPLWFKDKAETKYLWTSNFYQDQDEVVSLHEKPIEYNEAHSLIDKVLGGVRGFYYLGVDELVSKGEISRVDTIGEYELLQMLMFKRIDVGIISRSTLSYLTKAKGWQNQFHVSKQPHDKYQRRILVPRHCVDIYEEIAPIIANISNDPEWKSILQKY
jgi:polar amino acid transport system substrate-binding protein